jgi:hypothetical protein
VGRGPAAGPATLADKYHRMAALRRRLGRGTPDPTARAELRALAHDWPGALRELDSLPTEELDARAQACADRHPPPWVAWMERYHDLMRAALALRRGTAAAAAGVDADFADAVAAPGHGRLNVVVFARLALEFDTPARTMWDALFPRRATATGKSARGYRE